MHVRCNVALPLHKAKDGAPSKKKGQKDSTRKEADEVRPDLRLCPQYGRPPGLMLPRCQLH